MDSHHHTSLCRKQLLQDSMVVKGTCPDRSCIKQLRIYHARHRPSLSFPGATNVGHKPSQSGSTLDGFGSRDLQVFAEAKPSIQLQTQVFKALFPLNLMFPENDLRALDGSPVHDQQSLGLFRHLLSNQCLARHRLSLILSSRILTSSAAHTTMRHPRSR